MENTIIDLTQDLNIYNEAIGKFSSEKKQEEMELNDLNIFRLVSSRFLLENFHSSIIAEFINPKGAHKEGSIFLGFFLDFLGVSKEAYHNAEITTETDGRIDICIKGVDKVIIIENKINNATDMPFQLFRYYLYCIYELQLEHESIDKIIYLSLDGSKPLPTYQWSEFETWMNNFDYKFKNKVSEKDLNLFLAKSITHLSAFSNYINKDLAYGWLEKCITKSENLTNQFILKQYQQLLKQIRGKIMKSESLHSLYKNLIEQNKKSKSIINLNEFADAMLHIDIGALHELKIELQKKHDVLNFSGIGMPIDDGYNSDNKNRPIKVSTLIVENCLGTDYINLKIELFRKDELRLLITSKYNSFKNDDHIQQLCNIKMQDVAIKAGHSNNYFYIKANNDKPMSNDILDHTDVANTNTFKVIVSLLSNKIS